MSGDTMMHEMRDFAEGSELLAYLDNLPEHEVLACVYDTIGHWRTVVRVIETPPKRMGRRKGSKVIDGKVVDAT